MRVGPNGQDLARLARTASCVTLAAHVRVPASTHLSPAGFASSLGVAVGVAADAGRRTSAR